MRVVDLDDSVKGRRIQVTAIAPSPSDETIKSQCGSTDAERLVGQTGEAVEFRKGSCWAQLMVKWDNPEAGTLHLADADEIDLI